MMRYWMMLGVIAAAFWAAPLMAQPVVAPKKAVVAVKDDTEARYRDAMQMEQLRLYPKAKAIYFEIGRQFIAQSESGNKEVLVSQLPVVLSAVYRLGIVTARDNYYNVHPLVYQLDSFQDTQMVIDDIILIMSDLRKQGLVSRSLYESLYFSRAFNRLAWANKLLVGTAWKNYVVSPPADVVGMVGIAMADLDQWLVFQEFSPTLNTTVTAEKGDLVQLLNDKYLERFTALPKDSVEMKTYRLMNFEDDPVYLARLTAKRTANQVYSVLDFYNSPNTQKIIETAKDNYTLERMLSPGNQPFFKICSQFVSLIGVY